MLVAMDGALIKRRGLMVPMIIADILGLLTLNILGLACSWLISKLLPFDVSSALFGLLIASVFAVWVWHSRKANDLSRASQWLVVAALSAITGAVSAAIDVYAGFVTATGYGGQASESLTVIHNPLAVLVTLAFLPGFTIVALGSSLRALVLKKPSGKGL